MLQSWLKNSRCQLATAVKFFCFVLEGNLAFKADIKV